MLTYFTITHTLPSLACRMMLNIFCSQENLNQRTSGCAAGRYDTRPASAFMPWLRRGRSSTLTTSQLLTHAETVQSHTQPVPFMQCLVAGQEQTRTSTPQVVLRAGTKRGLPVQSCPGCAGCSWLVGPHRQQHNYRYMLKKFHSHTQPFPSHACMLNVSLK
jgi:hypothetical protein